MKNCINIEAPFHTSRWLRKINNNHCDWYRKIIKNIPAVWIITKNVVTAWIFLFRACEFINPTFGNRVSKSHHPLAIKINLPYCNSIPAVLAGNRAWNPAEEKRWNIFLEHRPPRRNDCELTLWSMHERLNTLLRWSLPPCLTSAWFFYWDVPFQWNERRLTSLVPQHLLNNKTNR